MVGYRYVLIRFCFIGRVRFPTLKTGVAVRENHKLRWSAGLFAVDNLRKHVHASGLSKNVELVVVSPLLRTMQTTVGAFGGEASADGIDVPPLMA